MNSANRVTVPKAAPPSVSSQQQNSKAVQQASTGSPRAKDAKSLETTPLLLNRKTSSGSDSSSSASNSSSTNPTKICPLLYPAEPGIEYRFDSNGQVYIILKPSRLNATGGLAISLETSSTCVKDILENIYS